VGDVANLALARAPLAGDEAEVGLDLMRGRRPRDFELSPRLRPAESSWLRMECSHVFGALWECSAALWVSQPSSIRRASLKLLQLDLARALGFTVPDFVH
jgi:hypothetical protein